MVINIFRGAGILLFILILIMDDFPFYKKMKEPYVQLILAIFTVFLLLMDPILGFIISMVLMLIYYEIYKKIDIKKGKKIKNNGNDKYLLNPLLKNKIYENFTETDKINKHVIEMDYITQQHLDDAQNNVIDNDIYNNELENKDLEIYYGVQGLKIGEENITGYNSNEYILNWL
jgi:Ca2+/Na+ antiporter